MTYENLESLFEAYEQKDQQRIEDIVTKSGGDINKAESLAKSMAAKITDYEKAKRRAEAAQDFMPKIAPIFYERAKELGGEVSNPSPLKTPSVIPSTPKERAVAKKLEIGDIIKITADMIMNGDVGISNGANWLFIKADDDKYINVNVPYRRSGGTSQVTFSKNVLDYLGNNAVFYFKVTKITTTWVEGNAAGSSSSKSSGYIFPSFFSNDTGISLIRVKTSKAIGADKVYDMFNTKSDKFNGMKERTKFLTGDETFVFDKDGKASDEIAGGTYVVKALNSKLTQEKGKVVVAMLLRGNKYEFDSENVVYATIDDLETITQKPTAEQSETIAEWLSKEIGAKVTVGKRQWRGSIDTSETDAFHIPWFKVTSNGTSKGFLGSFEKSPFFLESEAEAEIEEQKKLAKTKKLPYDADKLSVQQGGWYEIELPKLLDYAKLVGIDIKLKDFFQKKRGAIVSKSFGF